MHSYMHIHTYTYIYTYSRAHTHTRTNTSTYTIQEQFLKHESPRAVHDCGLDGDDCNYSGTGVEDHDRGTYMKARTQSLAQVVCLLCLCVLWGQRFRIFVIIPPTTTTSMMEEKPPSLPLTCTTHNTNSITHNTHYSLK